MHFSGTAGRLYMRKWDKYVNGYPSGPWNNIGALKNYLTATDGNHRFNDPANFTQIGSCVSWALNGSQSVLNATTLGDTDEVYEAGLKSATGTARILYYSSINSLGNGSERAADIENPINKLASRFFKISRWAQENGGPGATGAQRSYDDGMGSKADPFLFRFLIQDDPNNTYFIENPPPNSQNSINIDFWAHITAFNLTMATGEIFAADLSFQCIGCPTVSDL